MRRAVATATLLLAACDTTGAYVYFARSYDDARDCLGPTEALDVLAGDDPGLGCKPRCIAVKDPDGGTDQLYGTTACGPTPYGANATESDLRCGDVLSAVQNTRLCTPDSGLRDSGTDAGSASDASGDATSDATDDAAPDGSPADAAADAPAD